MRSAVAAALSFDVVPGLALLGRLAIPSSLTAREAGLRLGAMNRVRPVDPEGLPRPSHHSHGAVGFGDWLFVSAQTGRTREGRMASGDVAEQLAQALDN